MIEQLYTDFTTKILPTIQEGLVITKDYFTDLFGRYIKYLVITDSLAIIGGLFLLFISYFSFKKGISNYEKYGDSFEAEKYAPLFIVAILCFILGISMFIANINYLIKDIYLPEVRIYQELKGFNLK